MSQGRLEVVFRGVYRDPAAPVTFDQRAMAAVLAAGDGALVSHRMAIGLWGMPNYRCDLSEVTCRTAIVRPKLFTHRTSAGLEVCQVRGVPVTSPARTIVDCASVVSSSTLGRFMETWLSSGKLLMADLEEQMRIAMHRSIQTLTDALGQRTIVGEPDSPSESDLGRLLVRHGLPVPVLHHVVTVSSGLEYELDWSYPDLRIAFELDGYGVHLRSRDAFEHDRHRRNELEIDGWTILNFTRRMVAHDPSRSSR
jgi:hypothetical protein